MWIEYLTHENDYGEVLARNCLLTYLYPHEMSICFPLSDLKNLSFEQLQEIINWASEHGPALKAEYEQIEHDYNHGRTITPKKPKSGWVYLMRAENGYYKIGRSKDVPARSKQLNREYPIKIEVVHQFWATDYISREKDLHFLFKDKQQEGEWFALESRDIHTIMELTDEEPEPTS